MKKSELNYLLVGSFVLLMAVLLIAVLFKITGRDENTEKYFALFDSVTNIQEGTTVTYGGFPVGYVAAITPLQQPGQTRYRVALAVREGWMIPVDSHALLITPGMLSDTLVDIKEGVQTTLLQPGDTIASEKSPDMMAAISEAAMEIRRLSTESIQPLIVTVGETVTRLGENMDKNLQQVSERSLQLLSRLDENSQALAALLSQDNMQRFSSVLENADALVGELAITAKGLGDTGEEMTRFLRAGNQVIADNKQDIRATIVEANAAMQAISHNVDSIVYQLDNASRNLNEFSRRVRENPSALISGPPLHDDAEQ